MNAKVSKLLEAYKLWADTFYLPYIFPLEERKKIYEQRKNILKELEMELEKEYSGDDA